MHVIMTIFIKETEARRLWERCCEAEGEPPLGQELADWLSSFCGTTIESNFQFDASVDVHAEAECHSDTVALLTELLAVDRALDAVDTDSGAPEVNAAKERRDEIKTALVLDDDPEASEAALEDLMAAYRPLLTAATNEGVA